jgi:hypothetical protein
LDQVRSSGLGAPVRKRMLVAVMAGRREAEDALVAGSFV